MHKLTLAALLCGAMIRPASAEVVDLRETRTAASFVDGIGVNAHLVWLDTVYADTDKVESSLRYLGIRNVRDMAPPAWWMAPYERMAANGFRFNFVIPVVDGQTVLEGSIERAATLATSHQGSVAMIEGPNEVNYWPAPYQGSSDLGAAGRLQTDLHALVKGNAALKDVPVAGLTLGGANPGDYAPLGDLSGAVDFGNAHIYFPGGRQPSSIWGWALASGGTPTQGKGQVVTETGYFDIPEAQNGVSSSLMARRMLNVLAVAAKSGVQRTYIYQLFDPWADKPNDSENRFGLFRNDGSPKPAATAIRNLTAILGQGGSGPDKGDFEYEIENEPAATSSMVLAGEGGRTWVVAWAEPENWDETTRSEIPVPARETTLRLASDATMTVYDPAVGTSPVSSRTGKVATFSLTDHPVLIAVDRPTRSTVWFRAGR